MPATLSTMLFALPLEKRIFYQRPNLHSERLPKSFHQPTRLIVVKNINCVHDADQWGKIAGKKYQYYIPQGHLTIEGPYSSPFQLIGSIA